MVLVQAILLYPAHHHPQYLLYLTYRLMLWYLYMLFQVRGEMEQYLPQYSGTLLLYCEFLWGVCDKVLRIGCPEIV